MEYLHLSTADIDQLAHIIAESFNFPAMKSRPWIQASGMRNWRVLKEDDGVLGGLMMIPMGQWYGGKAVTMTGLAGVVVSPCARGKGAGQRVMSEALREMKQKRVGLSALYGSSTSFYRRVGYERAGANYTLELNLRDLDNRAGPLRIQTLTPDHQVSVERLQAEAQKDHACLRRGQYLWHRIRNPKGMAAEGVGFFKGDTLEGYIYFVRSDFKGTDNEIQLTDLVLTTPEAQASFLGYLAGLRAMFAKASWTSAESTSLLLALEERWSYRMTLHEHWLARIVDLRKALTARGYPPGVEDELGFQLDDSLFPENCGTWTLRVGDCEGQLEEGGAREGVTLDVGALSSLYTGFVSARELRIAGRLHGPDTALEAADRIFRGQPKLTDFF